MLYCLTVMKKDAASTTMLIDIPLEDVLEQATRAAPRGAPMPRGIPRGKKISRRRKENGIPVGNADLTELFQGVYDAAFITDLKGKILESNVRASQFFNYTRQELCEKHITDVILGLDESVLQTILENLQKDQFTLIQAYCGRKDGSQFPTEISSSRLRLSSEDYLCFFIRDITARRQAEEDLREAHNALELEVEERTKANEDLRVEIAERRRVEEELNKAIERLKEHDRAKSEFVSHVSHELKTPLTSIRYVVNNMLKGVVGPISDGINSYLAMMRQDCQRLENTVEDILDMSRIEANTLKLNLGKVQFARFVCRTVESLRIQAEAENLTMHVSINDANGFVECDPQKMERVIFNIVKNAIKFNVQGGSVDVTLRADPESCGFLVLDVADSGIGIEAKHLTRVTERFFRVSENVSGTGLGLAICKELLERHGGKLDLKSPPPGKDKGTLVSMRVPVADAPTVLIISDDESIRDLLMREAAGNGYRVASSESGERAFDIMREVRPDLVSLDWIAPGMEGSVTIAGMKGDGDLRDIPIIAITGAEMDVAKREILQGFGIPALASPWREEDLLNRLEEVILGKSCA